MPVTTIDKHPETRSMVVTAHFDAPIERVWTMWSNPRNLERWWGPPMYPATVVEHELTPGGKVLYYMTGPEGDRHFGYWKVTAVDAPNRLEVEDGFADDEGKPNLELPTTLMRVTLHAEEPARTRVLIESTFPSVEAMEQMLAMGMEEGLKGAMSQIDDLLLAAAS